MIQADNPILVSVVVPVYKIKEEYLRACVGSLLEHDRLKEIEIYFSRRTVLRTGAGKSAINWRKQIAGFG